jgi:hypothetical protein
VDSPTQIARRTVLRQAGVLAGAVAALQAAGNLAFVPQRALAAAAPSEIQFDISRFLAVPPQTYGSGVEFQKRAGALHHRDPAAELPGPAAPPPRVPAGRARLSASPAARPRRGSRPATPCRFSAE